MEMTRKLEEAKLKEEARWREKVMRKKPVWQALAYSHEEDLAMRCVPSLNVWIKHSLGNILKVATAKR